MDKTTSSQTPTTSKQSKNTSNQPEHTSKTSKPTTPTDFNNGNIDHIATAEQLEFIAKTGINIAKKSGDFCYKIAAEENSKHLLGLADWHLQQAENQCREAADQYANKAITINEAKARFATEMNDLKKREKATLADIIKEANSIKTKIRNFVKKNALKLFGKESGSFKTQQSEIKLRKNPAKLKQIDNSMSEEQLIERAKELGLRSVIVEKESISKEALERLSQDELERLGYFRESSQSFDIIPLAEPKAKATSKIAQS